MTLIKKYLKEQFNIDERVVEIASEAEKEAAEVFERINTIKEFNQIKVIKAMQDNNLSDSHFGGTTGYGYDDRGREVLDAVYANIFKAEDALVRQQIVAGTQAIAVAMFGNLRPGDELLSITGKPYDTLEEVIGIRGQGAGSLKEFGITYKQVDLFADGSMDFEKIKEAVNSSTKMILIQRSRGYSWRPSFRIADIEKAVSYVKGIKSDVIVLVDNCYGEFTEEREPIEVGADLVAGSLIKNPGGGLAPTGGYIAGKESYVRNAGYRLTTPGLGKKVGATLGQNRLLFQGVVPGASCSGRKSQGSSILCSPHAKAWF